METKIQSIIVHRSEDWEYNEHFVFDILDDKSNQLLRVIVYISNKDNNGRTREIIGVGIVVDAPLPEGMTSLEYLEALATLESQGYISGIKPGYCDIHKSIRLSNQVLDIHSHTFQKIRSTKMKSLDGFLCSWSRRVYSQD